MVVATGGASKRLVRCAGAALHTAALPTTQRLLASGSQRLPVVSATASRTRTVLGSGGVRHASSSSNKPTEDEAERHRTQYNYDPFTLHPDAKHYSYPLVTADDLAARSEAHSSDRREGGEEKVMGPGGRPREVRMLARDFIHDSLYNPRYGYFSKQAVLLPDADPASSKGEEQYEMVGGETYEHEMGVLRPSSGFEFNAIKNESEFMRMVEERYESFETQIAVLVQERQNALDAQTKQDEFAQSVQRERRERVAKRQEGAATRVAEYSAAGLEAAQRKGRAMAREGVQEADVQSMAAKQVWHTPTQIFQPYYAHAIARYLVAEYKLHNYPYDDLVIFELGAGSGALARGILDYLASSEPEIYTRTRYRIVEISERLAQEQRRKLARHAAAGRVEVVHRDVLAWSDEVVEPCFVIALEVLDNLAHDVVRFALEDLTPYQGVVSIDETGDMHELYEPLSDPLIQRYLQIIGRDLSPLQSSYLRLLPDRLRSVLAKHAPFFPNLSDAVFVPTNALRLFDTLNRFFPHHRLVMSDFNALPDSIGGVNAPVVQTRINAQMVPVTTYLVLQGYFDIFFPTNFAHLAKMYHAVNGAFFSPHFSPHQSKSRAPHVLGHAAFLERYAEREKLVLRDGSNPLLAWYQNASWFLT